MSCYTHDQELFKHLDCFHLNGFGVVVELVGDVRDSELYVFICMFC